MQRLLVQSACEAFAAADATEDQLTVFEVAVSHVLKCLWFKVFGFVLLCRRSRQNFFHYCFHEITYSKRPQLVFLFTKYM